MDRFAYGLSTPDGGKTFDLDIFSDIGQGGFFSVAKSANDVRQELLSAPQAKLIRQRINSRGGDVFEAVAMHSLLVQHPARVEAIVMGVAASAATIPMLAAEEISIVEQGLVMIHDVWGGAKGSPDELRDWADVLEKVNGSVAALYAKRTKKPRSEIDALMSAETWMTADEAKAMGFVDKILSLKTPDAKKAKAFAFAMARDMAKAPPAALALLEETPDVESIEPPVPVPNALNIAPGAPGKESEPPAHPSDPTENPMSIPKFIILALSAAPGVGTLAEDADENAVTAAIKKLTASARAGSSIEALLGVSGDAAVGAVRALKETGETNAVLSVEVDKLKIANARRDFESARDQGLKDKKLTPATAKLYTERFEAAAKLDDEGKPVGDGEAVAADLRGFLAVAPRLASASGNQPRVEGNGSAPQHDGKAFENMTPGERVKLKRDNVELYNTLREDAMARSAI